MEWSDIYNYQRGPYPCNAEMLENEVRAFAGEVNCELDRQIYMGHEKAARHQKRHGAEISQGVTATIVLLPEQPINELEWPVLRELACKAIAENDLDTMQEVVTSENFRLDGPIESDHRWNCLLLATYTGRKDHVHLLLENGAKVNAKDVFGHTPLIIAAREEFRDIVVELVRHGADTEKRDKLGYTALLTAAKFGNADALEALLQKGACVDSVLQNGQSALHIAAAAGQTAIASLLWKYGCRRDDKDSDGATPLELARKHHQHGTERLLLASLGELDEFSSVGRDNRTAGRRHETRHGHLKNIFGLEA